MKAYDFLADVLGQDGRVRTDLFSSRLRITKLQLAAAAGLSKDAVSKSARAGAPACVDCGVCSYVCPARLPLSQRVRQLKRAINHIRQTMPLLTAEGRL